MFHRQLPDGWDQDLPSFPVDPKGLASRDASGQVLNAVAQRIPWLIGGAADLAPSTKTRLTFDGAGDFSAANYSGRNFHFGIREHAMGAIVNGLSLSKMRPFGSGFLIFSDYGRGSLRLGALMELPVIYIFTHDSISVGEDGPTHQPVEHLASLRAIPGLLTLRPADANEVVEAWRLILQLENTPAALILSRQALPTLDRSKYAPASGLCKGAYILADAKDGKPDLLLLATGSEVALCVEAYEQLTADGVKARVVSMPCWEVFEQQDQAYRDRVIPPDVTARVSVEEASTFGWSRYVGPTGESIGMHTFGASAPLKALQTKFGFTPERVVAAAREQLAQASPVALSPRGRARVRKSTVGRESTVLPGHQYLESGIASGPYQANEKESNMKAAAPLQLREAGQSLWLDNITRDLLTSGTLKRYIDELSITGLTSNPTIFDHAMTKSPAYDAAIRQNIRQGKSEEELFFELAIEDLDSGCRPLPAHLRRDGRRRRLGLSGGFAVAGLRHGELDRAGQSAACTGGAA